MRLQRLIKFLNQKTTILMLVLFGLTISGYYTYNYSQKASAYKYVSAYNKKQFKKVYDYYDTASTVNKFSKEEIIGFLNSQWEMKNKTTISELTMIKDQKTQKWFVKFPYDLQSIQVLAPTGAKVYLDDKKTVESVTGRGVEIKDILPGRHGIRIEYYENILPPFTTEINVSKPTRVKSPYVTEDISVFAPEGTWVTMGGVKKQNTDEKVVFENMLPGQYNLTLSMNDQTLEIFSKDTQISAEDINIYIDEIKGNEKVRNDLEGFFSEFNKAYAKGIIEKDALFLHKFSTEINQDIISDFKMWYIENKEVEDARSEMEIQDIHPISGDTLKTSVLETVYLTNKEEGNDGDTLQEYRLVIEWDYKLLRSDSTWKIMSREILQSIVAYKDEKGNWVKY